MADTLLFNMCMIIDEKENKVLIQDKIRTHEGDWGGLTFPGGHIEPGESLVDSTIREVFEETGLLISNLTLSGVIHWENTDNQERWLIFLYQTKTYCGTLIDETEEGKVFWFKIENLKKQVLAPDMTTYLKVYFDDYIHEAYATWSDEGVSPFKLK